MATAIFTKLVLTPSVTLPLVTFGLMPAPVQWFVWKIPMAFAKMTSSICQGLTKKALIEYNKLVPVQDVSEPLFISYDQSMDILICSYLPIDDTYDDL